MSKNETTHDLPSELRARAIGNATDRTHQIMNDAADQIDRLDDMLERHVEFVRYLRKHLDGFLGDIPIDPGGLRKAMDHHGV